MAAPVAAAPELPAPEAEAWAGTAGSGEAAEDGLLGGRGARSWPAFAARGRRGGLCAGRLGARLAAGGALLLLLGLAALLALAAGGGRGAAPGLAVALEESAGKQKMARKITNPVSGRCLAWSETIVYEEKCAEGSKHQLWDIDAANWRIRTLDGRCMDNGGLSLHVWQCRAWKVQCFQVDEVFGLLRQGQSCMQGAGDDPPVMVQCLDPTQVQTLPLLVANKSNSAVTSSSTSDASGEAPWWCQMFAPTTTTSPWTTVTTVTTTATTASITTTTTATTVTTTATTTTTTTATTRTTATTSTTFTATTRSFTSTATTSTTSTATTRSFTSTASTSAVTTTSTATTRTFTSTATTSAVEQQQ